MANLVTYQIDSQDFLLHVNSQWDETALDNNGEKFSYKNVINRSIWDFICGNAVQDVYKILFSHVRKSKKGVSFDYRCDTFEYKRYMTMSIVPFKNNNNIQMYSQEVSRELQKVVINLDYVADEIQHSKAYLRCSTCNSFFVDNEWLEIEKAVQRDNFFSEKRKTFVISSVCGKCRSTLMSLGGATIP